MEFKLKCIEAVRITLGIYYGEPFDFVVGEIYDTFIDDRGLSFLIDGVYTAPYRISTICRCFMPVQIGEVM